MKIHENVTVVYSVIDENEIYRGEFETRKEANEFIDDRDDHGYDTILWKVLPEAHYNE